MKCCKNATHSKSNRLFLAPYALLAALAPIADLTAQENDDSQNIIEEVIVTGTAGGSEIRKLDASFSITTADADDIAKFAPKSTADLLKIVPGVWTESSGGVSGANVFVRGFPGGGDAPFYTLQLNGAPVFPPPTLSFLENTTLFRIDETVERVEALRGGPNPVFSNGQPGLTTNFILREGSEETEGLVKYTTSDYDLRRFDGYLSGQISDELYYMIGGYLSSSPGHRDAGFNAEEGNQFTINLTKDFANGTANVYHRSTDDHGTWYLPAALNVPGIDGEYVQVGTLNRQREVLLDNNSGDPTVTNPVRRTLDLGDGRGWDGSVTGGAVTFDFADEWVLVDRFNFTDGDADTLGLVPGGGAVQVGALLADPITDPNAVVTGPITGSVTGRAITDSEFIQQFGAWEVRKDIESFTNDISLAKSWDTGKVTFGFYAANASTDEMWTLGNAKYHVVETGGEVVTGIECNGADVDSCPGNFNFDIDATGDATTNAFYAAGEFDVTDTITIDVGVRFENHEVDYSVDEGLDGSVDKFVRGYDESEVSWTAAANFALNENMGVFGRINQGSKMPYFDDFRDNFDAFNSGNDLIQEVDQIEVGWKWVTDYYSLYATGFYTTVEPSFFVVIAGVTPGQIQDNEAMGLEVDANYFTDVGFSLNLNATLQDATINQGQFDGNSQQRQPDWQLRVTPSYEFEAGPTDITIYGTLSAIDDRFSDQGNTVVLDGYEKIDIGGIVTFDDRLSFQLAVDNLSDEDALTEGDPRNPAAPNGRFILPRSVTFSVGYAF